MKERLIGFFKTYILFVCIFIVQKPLFMLFYRSFHADASTASTADWFRVIWHGLPVDLSLAGYLTAIPGILYIISAWTLSKALHRVWCGYFLFASLLISLIFTVDMGLYEYWGFRLDAIPLFVAMAVYAALLYIIFYSVLLQKRSFFRMKLPYRRVRVSAVLLLLTGMLFIPIRGGSVSHASGQAYLQKLYDDIVKR